MQRQTKTINPVSMIRAQDKENKGPRSPVPVSAALTVSDSDDDKPARPEGRKKAVKELQFGNSPAKRNAQAGKMNRQEYYDIASAIISCGHASQVALEECIAPSGVGC